MWQIVAPLRGAMGSGSLTVKHTTSSMRQYVAPPSGDNLWITRPPSGGYILCQCGISSHRLRRATISCASVRGSHTISCVNATNYPTTSSMWQYVAPPSGDLYLVSMWHNVAAPFGGILYLVPRSPFHVPHIVSMRPIVAAPLRGVPWVVSRLN